ncbi:STAS domain-containing protein [Candidatus Solirubrobacter pratensis]|uniref:STAS domain-containing protein n=1 Tax=Candidatus Solirubrobacter pratensis TaxID=1298857 RepID=UPI000685F1AE|nr:STAS domain-containing protein [Candidatus Solirubrobacter pratensis]
MREQPDKEDSRFAVQTRPDRERAFVVAQGELDVATVAHVRGAVGELRSAGWDRIVLDLRGLTFMDSTGLCLLVELDRDARRESWQLTIQDGSGPVRRLLELSGLATHFVVIRD